MDIPEFQGYQELIDNFSFREIGGIRIPKSAREKAFSLQVDIEILSTRGNDYLNRKSLPAYGFYGYAVVILRDHCEIQIPITLPRQTLYYERREEAYSNWYSLYLKALDTYEKAWIGEFQTKPIAEALGLTVGTSSAFCPTFSGFEEVRIREVYVKCSFGTRFKLEVSRWQPNQFVIGDNCSYDGNSRQIDADKDSGLPDEGIQPSNNGDPDNPYEGYPSPSEESELGDFSLGDKLGEVDNTNPDNAPNEPAYKICSGTVTTYTTAPENPVGIPQDTYYFSNIQTPYNDNFIIESWEDSTSFTGKRYGVKLVPSNLWFTGTGFSVERVHWSQRDTRITGQCENP